MELSQTFNAVADLYDEVRPGYPDALFVDILGESGLQPGDRVLEVGCGTGQATRGFLAEGLRVLAIDPGPQLIATARRRFEGVDDVAFVAARFEDFEPEPGAFRLVASAQAWHWIAPEIGFRKATQALAPDGALAVFGHVPGRPPADVEAALELIYAELAPELWGPPPHAWYLPEGPLRRLFDESGLFGRVVHRRYAWREILTPDQVVRQLRTRSDYNAAPPERREPLLAAVAQALDAWREIDVVNETHLYLAGLAERR